MRFARLDGFTPTAASREGYDHYRSFEMPFEVTNDARAWLAGGHSIKAGFDYNHVFIDQTRGADGEYLTGNIPGPPFQMQVGFRLLF